MTIPSLPAETSGRALVQLRRGGDRLPFFCVHGSGGSVKDLVELAGTLDPAQPFYGLQAAGLDGVTPPLDSIEQMARVYLEEVKQLQPSGPYLLGGYSGGGVVAFEMARLLTAAGERVGLLAFIETRNPELPVRRVTFAARLAQLREGGIAYVATTLKWRRIRAREAMDERAIAVHLARGDGAPMPVGLRDLHLSRSFQRAAARYRPQPWAGRAVLFGAEEIAYIYRDGGASYGWEGVVTGGIEIVRLPGDHHSLLLGANAKALGGPLGAAIERANREAAQAGPIDAAR